MGATVERLLARNVNFLFATHLHALEGVLASCERLQWWHVEVTNNDGKLCFGRKLKPGVGPSNYGLEVAMHLLQDDGLMCRAHEIRRGVVVPVRAEASESKVVKSSKKVRAARSLAR